MPDDAPTPRPLVHPETTAIRAGREDNATALAPILWASTTFVTPTVEEGRRMATSVGPERFYSGMGALSAVVLGLCSQGDHLVAQRQIYAGTQLLLQSVCPRFGIDVTWVDGTDAAAWAGAVRPGKTVLLLAETPANPRLDLV